MEVVQRERCVLVTLDVDFWDIRAYPPDEHSGIIVVRSTRQSKPRILTREPEALAPDDLIAYAINRLHHASYRTIPLVDAQHRPIGIMTVNDIVQWLADLFPEAIVNLRPGGRLKRPEEAGAG